jgi:death-on-curing protein
MREFLTIAEIYRMQHQLIEMFGGIHGVRDQAAVEAAVFRPQTGYYQSIEEEAAALMESFALNHGFLDGNKRIDFTAPTSFYAATAFTLMWEPRKATPSSKVQSRGERFAFHGLWTGSERT